MATGDLFDKRRFCAADVLDRLTRHRLGREADEVAWMAGADRHSDLAVGLHAPDAWPMAGARVDDDDRRFRRIDNRAFGRNDADKPIIGRARQLAPVKDELIGEVQHIRHFLRRLREMDVSPLIQSLEGQDAPLARVAPILHRLVEHRRILQLTLHHRSLRLRRPEGYAARF